MRIDNASNSVNPHLPKETKAASHSGNADNGVTNRLSTSVDPKSIDSLLQLVGNATEIRESVVNDIKTQIQNGEYLARQTAVETASAILDL